MTTKLSPETQQRVVRMLDEGLSVTACAERFSVGATTILRIKRKYRLPSVPLAPSRKVKVRHRRISPLRRQWLYHVLDSRAKIPVDLTQLANQFHTSQEVIREAIAARKKLCPTKYGHVRNESESGEFEK